jgi:uncharacterized cofD-like protein
MKNKSKTFHQNPSVVVIGGGTGLATLLKGLKHYTSDLTAVVTVADDGGSSGRLRREMDILPPGDIRNCLVALAEDESLLGRLFQYRFEEGPLAGHSFGNLFLAALTKVTDDFEEAVRLSSSILAIRGQVLPASLDKVILRAKLADGSEVEGQSAIANSHQYCCRVWLKPAAARATAAVLEAIDNADVIVIGPGSLFTSIIPNLLIDEIAEAVSAAACPKVFVCNVMTQPGETLGFSAADHLAALLEHSRPEIVDAVLVNKTQPPANVIEIYQAKGAAPVEPALEHLATMGVKVMLADVAFAGDYFRHDSNKLAAKIMSLWKARKLQAAPE